MYSLFIQRSAILAAGVILTLMAGAEATRKDPEFQKDLKTFLGKGPQLVHTQSKALAKSEAQALVASKVLASEQTAKSSVRVFEIFESDSQRLPYGYWTREKGDCDPKSLWSRAYCGKGCQWTYHPGADERRVRSRYNGPFESSRQYVEDLKATKMFSGRTFAWDSEDWKEFRNTLEGIVADQLAKINPVAEGGDSDSGESTLSQRRDSSDDHDDGEVSVEDKDAAKRLAERFCKLPLSMRGHVPEYIEEYWTNRNAMWSFIDSLRKRNSNGTFGDDTYNLIFSVRGLLGDYIDLYQGPAHFFMRRDRFNMPREREWPFMWWNENHSRAGVCLSDQHLYVCRCWTSVKTKDGGSGPSYAPRVRELYLKKGEPSTSYVGSRGLFNVSTVIKADPGLSQAAAHLGHYRRGYHDNVASQFAADPGLSAPAAHLGHYRRDYHDNVASEFLADPGRTLPIGDAPTAHFMRPHITVADLNDVIGRFRHVELIEAVDSAQEVKM